MRQTTLTLILSIALTVYFILSAWTESKKIKLFAYGIGVGITLMIFVFCVIDLITGNMIFIHNV